MTIQKIIRSKEYSLEKLYTLLCSLKYISSFWFWFSFTCKKFPRVHWQVINSYKVRHSHKLRKDTQGYWLDIKSIDFINFIQCEGPPTPPGRILLSVKTIFCLNGKTGGTPAAILTPFDIFISFLYCALVEIFQWIIKILPLFPGHSGPAG